MTGGKILDQINLQLKNRSTGDLLDVYIDVYDNSLSNKWLSSLNNILTDNLHLEKNYCFVGFEKSKRDLQFLCQEINKSIQAINDANLGYDINDHFTPENCVYSGPIGHGLPGMKANQEKFNKLHLYFEELQGTSGNISNFYTIANPTTRWHIRQLNLLCHEAESFILSLRKAVQAPDWRRPSQLMCWLNSPRFILDEKDFELFGIDTIARFTGGVYVGVNKAVGKHHWEVFNDEGRDSRIDELTTTTLKSQTEASGDFDIEWGKNNKDFDFMIEDLQCFRTWLTDNGFDPDDKSLTIGHPQVAQVNLQKSFNSTDSNEIWNVLNQYLDVYSIRTSDAYAKYDYHWSDADFMQRQIDIIGK